MDLAEAVEFDEQPIEANIQAVRPGMQHLAAIRDWCWMRKYLQFLTGPVRRAHREENAGLILEWRAKLACHLIDFYLLLPWWFWFPVASQKAEAKAKAAIGRTKRDQRKLRNA